MTLQFLQLVFGNEQGVMAEPERTLVEAHSNTLYCRVAALSGNALQYAVALLQVCDG